MPGEISAPPDLSTTRGAAAYVLTILNQLYNGVPATFPIDDPLYGLEDLRALAVRYQASGIPLPAMRDVKTDPLGYLLDWADVFASLGVAADGNFH